MYIIGGNECFRLVEIFRRKEQDYFIRIVVVAQEMDFLISDALPFGGLWYTGPNATSNAVEDL